MKSDTPPSHGLVAGQGKSDGHTSQSSLEADHTNGLRDDLAPKKDSRNGELTQSYHCYIAKARRAHMATKHPLYLTSNLASRNILAADGEEDTLLQLASQGTNIEDSIAANDKEFLAIKGHCTEYPKEMARHREWLL